MSHVDPGPLASYESLADPNLTAYFNNSRMRKHLMKSGLVTRRGEIVSEKIFRLNNARKEHQRHVRDLLAQAIVHKALDMERHRQMQVKKQLEEIGKVERVRRVRADRALRGDEDILPLLSPPQKLSSRKKERPHTAPAGRQTTSTSMDRQLPQSVGYPAIPGDSPYNTRSTRIKTPYPDVEIDNQYLSQLDKEALRTFTLNLSNYDLGSGVSPYTVPVLDPASREILEETKPKKKKKQVSKSKGRPSTAIGLVSRKEKQRALSARSNKYSLELHRREPPMIYRTQSRSLCLITFKYLGQIVHLDCETEDARDEITVDQQHCGGGNLCIYKGRLLPGNNFTVISQRHRGFPFSLTFYLNGIMVERLSTCCEYKHKMGYKLGAKTSHFGFVKVEGAHPCYRCMVAAGRFRSTSDQSALKKNTFQPQEMQDKKQGPSQQKEKEAVETKAEEKYDDSFVSSDESSEVSSVSTLTPTDDESASSHSSSDKPGKKRSESSKSRSTKGSRTPSPKLKPTKGSRTPSPRSPKRERTPSPMLKKMLSKSTDSGSASNTEGSASDTETKPKEVLKVKQSSSSSGSSSSYRSSSDEEEIDTYHPNPTALRVPIRTVSRQQDTIDLSHFDLSEKQVEELIMILKEDSVSVKAVVLYNCNLNVESLDRILHIIASCYTNLNTLNVGRNRGINIEQLLNMLKTTDVETLMLDYNPISNEHANQFMDGLKLLYELAGKAHANGKKGTAPLNQMTVIPPGSLSSDDDRVPSLKHLSMNGVRINEAGVNGIASFLSINPSLKTLHLSRLSLASGCFVPLWKVLSSGQNDNLKELFLDGNKINDDGLKKFSSLMTEKSVLEKLTFTNNGITNDGAAKLVDFAKRNKYVKHIHISRGNSIKRKTLKNIRNALSDK